MDGNTLKHIFIVNPQAGRSDASEAIRREVEVLRGGYDVEVYVTRYAGDGTRFVRGRCEEMKGMRCRFYACGGDGTLNEVLTGMMGYEGASLSCVPVGSGNDYVKYYGGREAFLDLRRLMDGEERMVDVMRVNGSRYALNVCNFGFDAVACRAMTEVRRKRVIGGRNAYTTGIVKALFKGRRTRCRVVVDGEEIHDGEMLLCTLGNGRYVGGAYQCSPQSLNDDGLIEVCLFKPLSLFRFASMLKPYREGTFMERRVLEGKMIYRRGRRVEVVSEEEIDFCIDGEMIRGQRFAVEQMPGAVKFVVPRQ